MDIEGITTDHAARLAALDPLLPTPPPLVADVLTVGGAAGVPTFHEARPGSAQRTWQPVRRHRLDVRLAGPDLAGDLGGLLDRWLTGVGHAGDPDSAAVVDLASRDTEAVPALIERGFVPVAVTAIRRAAPATPVPGVRPATVDDLAAAVRLNLEVVEYDARFGKVTMREETAAVLADGLRERLSAPEPQAWVAERDGAVVGLVTVQLPPESSWVSGLTSASPVGYLETMSVTAALRGSGLGSALVTHAHAALDAVAPATLLHHALPNPLSTPFWYRHGYRPLWTTWQRRPATPAG